MVTRVREGSETHGVSHETAGETKTLSRLRLSPLEICLSSPATSCERDDSLQCDVFLSVL